VCNILTSKINYKLLSTSILKYCAKMSLYQYRLTLYIENYYENKCGLYALESDRSHDEARYRLPDNYVTLKPITDADNR